MEHEPNQHFNRWWECAECWAGFEMHSGVLIFGRTIKSQGDFV
jgi:hypothetical protein